MEVKDNLGVLFDNFLKSVSENVRMKMCLFQKVSSFSSSREKALKKTVFFYITRYSPWTQKGFI